MFFVRGKKGHFCQHSCLHLSAWTLQVKSECNRKQLSSSTCFFAANSQVGEYHVVYSAPSLQHPSSFGKCSYFYALLLPRGIGGIDSFWWQTAPKNYWRLGLRNWEHFHINSCQWDRIHMASWASSVRDLAANSQANKRNTDLFSDAV